MLEDKKTRAAAWFRELRDTIRTTFETLEDRLETGPLAERPPGRFECTAWERPGGGGGEMSVMRGRVFEKVGVNISTVHGEFSDAFRGEIPGTEHSPAFWASGISLVAHMHSPHVPAVHMNTRMIATETCWFGGGADLTPLTPDEADSAHFHAALKAACDRHNPEYYPEFKAKCDEYFTLAHRNEPRGIGGIFYDYLDSGDWEDDFAFTQAVGRAFLDAYVPLVERHMQTPWSVQEREALLYKRGRYVEFNLLYDRGTRFGLMTGGNVDAILMSLPPEVRWG